MKKLFVGIKNFFARAWHLKTGRVLLILSCLLLLAAAGSGLSIYLEGKTAEKKAQDLLDDYVDSTASHPPESTEGAETASPVEETPGMIGGYIVIGTLSLEKTGQTLPVIAETNTLALKVSVCWYEGARPGEEGNMVITGHNFESGAHFGRLSELDVGDRVLFEMPGASYTYAVYETEIIRPDQPEELGEYEGDMALTLLTCTNHGNRRLVVRCRLVEE